MDVFSPLRESTEPSIGGVCYVGGKCRSELSAGCYRRNHRKVLISPRLDGTETLLVMWGVDDGFAQLAAPSGNAPWRSQNAQTRNRMQLAGRHILPDAATPSDPAPA